MEIASLPAVALKESTLRTSTGGRGFVVQGRGPRYVITAAHCLPWLPPAMTFSGIEERTYNKLLGKIGAEADVAAECIFVDPVSDLAVLTSPDNQELSAEADAYEALTDSLLALRMAALPNDALAWPQPEGTPVWLLSLAGEDFRGSIIRHSHFASLKNLEGSVDGGMSGSPIVNADGHAVSLVTSTFQDPALAQALPQWLADELAAEERVAERLR